ncbi:hypothetical protein [Sulfurimonas sp. C5]|uniref:hypothetical protein n=1 Tax=Sulfurimonas sp. C5 TaxID=3036947 RepID=UPI00245709F8|nr:hypothetical protein [Sulfurimonas sp. C5]MDH4945253.1 hypothetical protein [Sulfurimonas sp. C5]
MKDKINDNKTKQAGLWEWVKALSTLCIVSVFSYKVYITPISLTVDFPTLLSLLLALFSVALAALFYFKATETSNTFYDNTYNFTKDIAQLLVKIESGFGERLRNLDEGYTSMRDYLQHYNDIPKDNVEQTKQKIETEKTEMAKVITERNEIIEQLIERSNLQQEEKSRVMQELKEKDSELTEAQKELSKMKRRLFVERLNKKQQNFDVDERLIKFTRSRVINVIGEDRLLKGSKPYIKRRFDRVKDQFPDAYINDLEQEGFYDDGLTDLGYQFLKDMAEN